MALAWRRRIDTSAGWPGAVTLVAFLALTAAVAAAGSVATSSGMDWYETLERPAFTPPGWAFGAAWTPLYVLIAIAGALLWRARATTAIPAALWFVQLALNLAWTWIFFGLQEPGWALAEIVVLLCAIAALITAAWPVSRGASLLLVPYLGWVCFAAALNFEFWRLN